MLLVSIVSNKWFVRIKELWTQLGVWKSVPFLVIGISRSQLGTSISKEGSLLPACLSVKASVKIHCCFESPYRCSSENPCASLELSSLEGWVLSPCHQLQNESP